MKDAVPEIMDALDAAFRAAGLETAVLWHKSEFMFLGYNIVRLVVADAEKVEGVRSVVNEVHAKLNQAAVDFEYRITAEWKLESIDDVEPLYSGDGGLRAASVISVHLRAGETPLVANVIVTWAADRAIRDIVPKVDLREVTRVLVQAKLAQRGSTAWDPATETTLEINAAAAPYVSHLLREAA